MYPFSNILNQARGKMLSWLLFLGLASFFAVCGESHAVSAPITLQFDCGWEAEPNVAADADGNWVATWASAERGLVVCYSTDAGETWSTPSTLQPAAPIQPQHAQIVYGNGRWVCVYEGTLGGASGTSLDILVQYGGKTGIDNTWVWTDPVTLNQGAPTDTLADVDPKLATDGAGHWMCAWHRVAALSVPSAYNVVAATGVADGDTWTWTPTPLLLDDGPPSGDGDLSTFSLASGGAGAWMIVWDPTIINESGSQQEIRLTRTTDNGVTWSTPATLTSNGRGPKIVADGAGNCLATYLNDAWISVISRSTDNGLTWNSPSSFGTNEVCVLPDRRGRWVALWADGSTNWGGGYRDISMVQSGDAGATWTSPVLFNTDANADVSAILMRLGTDAAGNWVGIWSSYIGDGITNARAASFTVPPRLGPTINQAGMQADPAVALPIVFDVVFEEPVTGFGDNVADVDFSNGTARVLNYTVLPTADPPDNLTFTVNVLAVDGLGSIIAEIPAGVCQHADKLPNLHSTSDDNEVVNDIPPPQVVSITRSGGACRYVRSLSVDFDVTFDQPMTGVDASDFRLDNSSVANTAVLSITPADGYHTTYTVTVNTGQGIGAIQLDLVDNDSITQEYGVPLGYTGAANGDFTAGETYFINKSVLLPGQQIPLPQGYVLADLNLDATTWDPPTSVERRGDALFVVEKGGFTIHWVTAGGSPEEFCQELSTSVCVQSITRFDPSMSHIRDDSAVFRVQFSEGVTGVDMADFSVANATTTGCAITALNPVDAQTYRVTVTTGAGPGLVQLDVLDNGSIFDLLGNPLGGPTLLDGGYTDGQRYAIDKTVYKIGDPIAFPIELGFTKDSLDLAKTTSVPVTKVNNVDVRNLFFVESATTTSPGTYSGLFVGDAMTTNPHSKSYTTITWTYNDGSPTPRTFDQEILVSSTPTHTPMRVYHTDTSQGETGAAKVDLKAADVVLIHHNTRIRPDADPNPAPTSLGDEIKYMWVESPSVQIKDLHARFCTGLVVLHFEDAGLNFLGVQVVDVRPFVKDYEMPCDIGYEPAPHDAVTADYAAWPPYVSRGKTFDINTSYLYQHDIAGSPKYGKMYAVRKTTKSDQVEIFWKRLSEGTWDTVKALAIQWPYEMARYTFDWPTDPAKYQRYVRASTPVGVSVPITNSSEFFADVMPYTEAASGFSGFKVTKQPDKDGAFETNGPGWALVRYQTGSPPGIGDLTFTVVRSVLHDDTAFFPDQSAHEWPVGTEVTDPYHEPQPYHQYAAQAGGAVTKIPGTPGYLYVAPESGEDRYDWKAYDGNDGVNEPVVSENATGQIFAVNTGEFEVWWYNNDIKGTAWPSFVKRYEAKWADTITNLTPWPTAETGEVVIASTLGTGPILYNIWELYYQNDPTRPGFNPNDEHAVAMGNVVYPLRDDLGTAGTSLPYVLVRHRHPDTTALWQYKVYKVKEETPQYPFAYAGTVGTLIQPPLPISAMQKCTQNSLVSGPGWRDRNLDYWVKSAGDDGGAAQIVMKFWYPANGDFYWPDAPHSRSGQIPWLDRRPGGTAGTPINVEYDVNWPTNVPTMKVGDTLVKAKLGLPAIYGRVSASILYQQAAVINEGRSVQLIDFKRARPVNPPATSKVFIPSLPSNITTQFMQGLTFFPKLSPALKPRVVYDAISGKLGFRGFFVEPPLGDYYSFLNVMSLADKTELLNLSPANVAWQEAVAALYTGCRNVLTVPNDATDFESLALTAGFATAGGYVTLAFENAATAAPLPVSLEVIRVQEEFASGEIAVVTADCPFDERLVLMHKGDFNGEPQRYQFEWRTLPDLSGTPPSLPYEQWNTFTTTPADGTGARTITIGGPGIFTLSDNWFTCRYKKKSSAKAWPDDWSGWTQPQLAEGWIKRVVGEINPFTQRASGGGIEGAEVAFSSFADKKVNTVVSMISQAGPRWGGDVPMNCLNLDNYGLIEIYETVFGRGMELSINGSPPVKDYEPANKALLLVAGRVADLYMLLGNEAYADAADPTIAYGTEDGTYGAESTSIHCFMNMTSSQIDEELALLRGRDNALMPPVSTPPVYNRLVWNFTGDITGGEVAYALNYNIQDQNGNVDGTISEADAKKMYPQGHGDAWGHYLTAIMRYYTLLRHKNYLWTPRAEAVMVGGVPVTVDYLDERKFAKAAAARAHAGSEITSLTYRSLYTEDPAGQWQGYKDDDPDRAWGVSDWACRSGMGAYFDWVAGNAILPAVDDNPEHEGIQKIDRTTVTELREVAGSYAQIEAEMRKADMGLNPLGLAKDIVPFDFDPTGNVETRVGFTHFEQVYVRAVAALDNAVAVFNNANNCTQLLRQQADSTTAFQKTVDDQEADFNNRLIELYGYPYADDIGPTGTYPTGYNGPDIYHFDIVETSALLGEVIGDTQTFTVPLSDRYVTATGEVRDPSTIPAASRTATDNAHIKTVTFNLSKQGYGIVKSPSWTGQRRAPGEIQLARSDLLQAIGTFKQARKEYDNVIADLDEQVTIILEKENKLESMLAIRGGQITMHVGLNGAILLAKSCQLGFTRLASLTDKTADTIAEAMPKTVGVIGGVACGTVSDMTSFARATAKGAAGGLSTGLSIAADVADVAQTGLEQAKEIVDMGIDMAIEGLSNREDIKVEKRALLALIREEAVKRIEMFTLQEGMQQASGRYLATLASGARLLDDRLRFRQQTAASVQNYRYKDMAFRVFRNDALQKYRAQFDFAARYAYLAAKAYDFESNLLGSDTMSGQHFLSDIVRARSLGVIQDNGQPMTGGDAPSLADSMARMWQNFDLVLRGRLGFNNPQNETNRFSLRRELFRTADTEETTEDDEKWRETLSAHVVDNILAMPEFKRYCKPFSSPQAEEPGIVIPFSTCVEFGMNFFGWPLAGGDSAYDSSNFATKIRSVGVWFTGYDSLSGGMSNTPRVYLIPVGEDIMRAPGGTGLTTRKWTILDQKLPMPFPVGVGDLDNTNWIPRVDTLQEVFADIRQFSSFRAYHDSGEFDPSEAVVDTRLIGRSVWNTRWMLVIPAGTLLNDRQEALQQFIYGPDGTGGVSDILIYFQTYAYSGGKKDASGVVADVASGVTVEQPVRKQ